VGTDILIELDNEEIGLIELEVSGGASDDKGQVTRS
jgi:hypothetical protein